MNQKTAPQRQVEVTCTGKPPALEKKYLNSEVKCGLNCTLMKQLDWNYFINITINLIISVSA